MDKQNPAEVSDDEILAQGNGNGLNLGLYRSLVHSLPLGVVAVIDREYRYRLLEGPLLARLAILPGAVVGKQIQELLPEEVAQQRMALYSRALAGETVSSEHVQEGRFYRSQAIPLRNEQGEIEAALIFAEDVTENRLAEQALAERARQQTVVARLGQRALSGLPLSQLMEEAVVQVAETLELEYTKILELLPGGKEMLLRAGVGWKPEYPVGTAMISAGLESQAGYTLLSEEPVVVDDMRAETRFSGPPLLHEHRVISGLSVIIGSVERPWGVFGAHTTRHRSFGEHDITFLQATANIIATAIERQRTETALRESERHFRGTFENVAVGIAHVGLDGSWLRMNNRLCDIVGYTREELLHRTFQDITHPDDLEDDLKEFGRLLDGQVDSYQIEKRYLHKEGGIVWIMLTATVQRDEEGESLYALAVVEDITRRKQTETALRRSEEMGWRRLAELEATYHTAPVGLCVLDKEMRYVRINERLARANGLPVEAHLGRSALELIPDLAAQVEPLFRQVLETGEPVLNVEIAGETAARPGQKQIRLEHFYPLHDGQGQLMAVNAVVEDVTERRQTEQERERLLQALAEERGRLHQLAETLEERVQERTEQVRQLASELTLAEQRERRRIAQMLHDDLQQMLVALQMQLYLIGQRIPPEVQEELKEMETYTGEIIDVTRSLSVQLGSPAMRGERLEEAAGWLQGYMAERYQLQVELELEGDAQVSDQDLRELIVGLVRELLFNVVKHAEVQRARLAVRMDRDQLVIIVEDKGRGFSLDAATEGFGLRSVRERLALFGGALELVSSPGEGTRAVIRVPVR